MEDDFCMCYGCDCILSEGLDDIYHSIILNKNSFKTKSVLCEDCAKMIQEGLLEDRDGDVLELIDFTYVSLV